MMTFMPTVFLIDLRRSSSASSIFSTVIAPWISRYIPSSGLVCDRDTSLVMISDFMISYASEVTAPPGMALKWTVGSHSMDSDRCALH